MADAVELLMKLAGNGKPERLARMLADPRWATRGRVHDWRNYIPSLVREHWDEWSPDARAIAYIMAESRADAEEQTDG